MSRWKQVTTLIRQAGAAESGIVIGLAAAGRVLALRVLQVVAISRDRLDPRYLELDPRFEAGFVEAERLLAYVADHPDLDMDEAFVREACARGDLCYAITDHGEIVSYGWYSNRPTEMFDGLVFCFDSDYTYMYKGYTKPEYRGRRLHAVGMSRALDAVSGNGLSGLVSFVDRTNTASLRSVHRMGYADVAKVAIMGRDRSQRVLHLGGRPRPNVRVQPAAVAV